MAVLFEIGIDQSLWLSESDICSKQIFGPLVPIKWNLGLSAHSRDLTPLNAFEMNGISDSEPDLILQHQHSTSLMLLWLNWKKSLYLGSKITRWAVLEADKCQWFWNEMSNSPPSVKLGCRHTCNVMYVGQLFDTVSLQREESPESQHGSTAAQIRHVFLPDWWWSFNKLSVKTGTSFRVLKLAKACQHASYWNWVSVQMSTWMAGCVFILLMVDDRRFPVHLILGYEMIGLDHWSILKKVSQNRDKS